MVNIETFNVDEDLMQDFDYDGVDDLAMGLTKDSKLLVNSISTLNGPFAFESITTQSNLDLNMDVAWETLKMQPTLNQKSFTKGFYPFLFFIVIAQTTCIM